MKKILGRITSILMAAVLLTGVVPALNAEAATLKKPANCHFVKWLERDDFDECRIQWGKVAGADGYQTLLTWTDGSHAQWKTWGKNTTTANFYDLEDEHVSQVKVRAFKKTSSGNQYGPWSNVTYITPSPDDYTLKKSTSGGLQAKITWDIVYGSNGYNVFVTTNPKGTWVWNQSTATKASAHSATVKSYR